MSSVFKNTIIISIGALLWAQCSNINSEETAVKPLVYEGMSSQELERVLGKPNEKDSVSAIYLADQKKTVAIEKWFYDKRIVLIINDTIKDPNVK